MLCQTREISTECCFLSETFPVGGSTSQTFWVQNKSVGSPVSSVNISSCNARVLCLTSGIRQSGFRGAFNPEVWSADPAERESLWSSRGECRLILWLHRRIATCRDLAGRKTNAHESQNIPLHCVSDRKHIQYNNECDPSVAVSLTCQMAIKPQIIPL